MKPVLIFPVSKSPHQSGRVGPEHWQDWYRCALKARDIFVASPGASVLIATGFEARGEEPEADLYVCALTDLGVPRDAIIVRREGRETVRQIECLREFASTHQIVVISPRLHYWRVRWLIYRCLPKNVFKSIRWEACHGIPRPREAVYDIALSFLFPAIDLLGLRSKYLQWIEERREKGKI